MKATITAITQSRIKHPKFAGNLSPDEHIVYVARVSNPSNQLNTETGPRLLAHCIRHNHWSVFEHVYLTVEVETSRAIAAQILRHRSFTFQEFSQRYADVTKLGDLFEDVELRLKADGGNRQGSGATANPEMFRQSPLGAFACKAGDLVRAHLEASEDLYRQLLKTGVAPECARMVLPLTTKTRLYITGNVRSWIHYFNQRCDSHAQKEHQQLAKMIYCEFRKELPTVAETLELIAEERRVDESYIQIGREHEAECIRPKTKI